MNSKTFIMAGGIVGAMTWYQVQKKWRLVKALRWFEPEEWRGQWGLLDPALLLALDDFRDRIGRPVVISPDPGALFRIRPEEAEGNSQHFFGRAADVMLPGGGLDHNHVTAALAAGFTGIGFYPHWKPWPGLHLDVRPGKPATWSGLNPDGSGQYYAELSEGFLYV